MSRSVEEKAYVKARIRTQKGSLEVAVKVMNQKEHILTANDDILIPKSFSYVR